MARNDNQIPRRTAKLVFQQCDSRCAFCGDQEISVLDIHHIIPRRDGGSNDLENLLVACKNCHARVETGEISADQVNRRKRILVSGLRLHGGSGSSTIQINAPVTSSIVAQNVHLHSPKKASVRVAPAPGTIGARPEMKNYVDHLITRYHKMREADASYGRTAPLKYGLIHVSIQRKFGAKTFFLPESLFEDLATYLQERIDSTIQGRVNRRNSEQNYSEFSDYLRKYGHAK
ncbi:MAG TPA: HNH endonuclease [Longimicrobium sp.]